MAAPRRSQSRRTRASAVTPDVFAGTSEMAALMRTLDWAATAIGPVEGWPQSLRTALSICLAARLPIMIWWGPELIQLYNDACRPVLGATKHPRSMGQRAAECWAEIWDVIGPRVGHIRATGEAAWSDNLLRVTDRNHYIEETYFTFSCSPIRDEAGAIGGILVICTETTERVLGERRPSTLTAQAVGSAPIVEEAARRLPDGDGTGDAGQWMRGDTAIPDPAALVPHPSARILVADDNADLRDYLCRLLGGRWVVEAVASGDAALAAARERVPDLVIADVMMPDMDGMDLLRALRADPRTRRAPVIMLSARAGEESRLEGLAAGADDYLVKPFSARELVARAGAQIELARVRREGETALQAAEARYRGIFEHALEGIFQTGFDGRFQAVNAAGARILGYASPEELIASVRNAQDVYVDPARLGDYLRLMQADGAVTNFEFEARRKDGSSCWLSLNARAVAAAGGRITSVEGMVTDITERKRAEAQREALLAQERAARAEAEAANRAKDEFLSLLSHELRTPLTPILGFADMLRRPNVTQDRLAYGLDVIRRSARTQARLVADLLDVSRIVTGKLQLEPGLTELLPVVESAIEAVAPAVHTGSLTLTSRLDPNVGPVMGDADRLQQVVTNLLANAIKFTPAGGRVTVALHRDGAEGRITVSDSGMGIAADFLPHIFERFRQADASSTRSHGGLGLGLAIARHLVELHSGSITAESPGEGQGATFTVRLPLVSASGAPTKRADLLEGEPPGLTAAPAGGVLAGLHVLVADDDPDTRAFIRLVLEQERATVTTVGSSAEALAALTATPPHLLVADIGMPGDDGYALIARVRARPPGAGGLTPSLALTAYASGDDRHRALAAGFQQHLAKPVDPAALVSALAALASMFPLALS